MRLKEDSSSWRASSIVHRDNRHTYGDPEIPKHRKQRGKKYYRSKRCKHVWVEVSAKEYARYRKGWPWYDRDWTTYYTYYVCAECLDTKTKIDKGKRRAYYRK